MPSAAAQAPTAGDKGQCCGKIKAAAGVNPMQGKYQDETAPGAEVTQAAYNRRDYTREYFRLLRQRTEVAAHEYERPSCCARCHREYKARKMREYRGVKDGNNLVG